MSSFSFRTPSLSTTSTTTPSSSILFGRRYSPPAISIYSTQTAWSRVHLHDHFFRRTVATCLAIILGILPHLFFAVYFLAISTAETETEIILHRTMGVLFLLPLITLFMHLFKPAKIYSQRGWRWILPYTLAHLCLIIIVMTFCHLSTTCPSPFNNTLAAKLIKSRCEGLITKRDKPMTIQHEQDDINALLKILQDPMYLVTTFRNNLLVVELMLIPAQWLWYRAWADRHKEKTNLRQLLEWLTMPFGVEQSKYPGV